MSNNESDWKTRARVIQSRLQTVMANKANVIYRELVTEVLERWSAIQAKREGFPGMEDCFVPVRPKESATRGRIFTEFVYTLLKALMFQDALHFTALNHILEDNFEIPVKQWPHILLTYSGGFSTEVIGFRNRRVSGGDGRDYRWYYFPEWYMREFGRDAVKEQSNDSDRTP